MERDEEEKRLRQRVLKTLTQTNDATFILLGNYVDEDSIELEYAVDTQEGELFEMFLEVFKDETVRSEARKAILYCDYGDEDADSLNLN
jgi:hypothetical protein